MGYGFKPQAASCTESRLLNVVFPLDDGPDMRTTFTSLCLAICSAMLLIFFLLQSLRNIDCEVFKSLRKHFVKVSYGVKSHYSLPLMVFVENTKHLFLLGLGFELRRIGSVGKTKQNSVMIFLYSEKPYASRGT